MTPRATVIIPTVRRGAFLQRALSAAMTQTIDDVEVIVVDDSGRAPTDLSLDRRATYLRHSENRGAAAAWLTGIANAHADYIAFLPDDDFFLPTFLETRLARFDEDEDEALAVVFSRYLTQNEVGETLSVSEFGDGDDRLLTSEDLLQAALRHRIFLAAGLYRRDYLRDLPQRVITSGKALDYAINVEIALRGGAGYYLATTDFVYVDHPGQTRHSPRWQESFIDKQRFLEGTLQSALDGPERRSVRCELSDWNAYWGMKLLLHNDRRAARRRFAASVRYNPRSGSAWAQLAHTVLPS